MKLKKSTTPLGSSEVCCARGADGKVEFFMHKEGVVVRREFDLAAHALKTDSKPTAYADAYLALTSGAVINLGELVYLPKP